VDAIKNIASTQNSTGATGAGKSMSTQDIIAFSNNLDTQRAAETKPSQANKTFAKSSDTKEADAKSADAKSADAKAAKAEATEEKIDAKVADRKDVKAADAAKSADAAATVKADAKDAANTKTDAAQAPAQAVASGTPAAPLVTLLQDDGATTDLQQNLQQLFDKLPGTDAQSLAQFRTDAIKMMKSMGMNDADIQQNLVQFAINQGDALTTAQATQIMMPLQAAPAPTNNAAAKDDADMAAVISRRKPQDRDAAKDATPADVAATVAAQVTKQLQTTGAKAPAAATAAAVAPLQADQAAKAPAAAPAAPAPQQAQDTSKNAPAQMSLAHDAASLPTPKAPVADTAHVALVNGFAASGSGADSGASGDQSFNQFSNQFAGQADANAGALSGLKLASDASTGSFVNNLNAANAAQGTTTMQTIAMQIQQSAAGKVNTFTMQLNPAELGGLEVRLKFTKDGALKAQLTADKPETLSMLQKDAPQLHRILQGLGMNADDASLSFNLRQQNQQQGQMQDAQNGNGRGNRGYDNADNTMDVGALQANLSIEAQGSISQRGVNIVI